MFIDDFYQWVLFIVAKDFNGYITPIQFNMAENQAEQELYNKYRGLVEDYQPNNKQESPYQRDQKRIGDGQTGILEDMLAPFYKPAQIFINSKGLGQVPTNYAGTLSVRKLKYNSDPNHPQWTNIEVLTPGEFANRTSSKIRKPSLKYPVCMFTGNTIQFVPYNLSYCTLDYRSTPIKTVWAFTNINNRPVFNPSASTDTEWPQIAHLQLKARILYWCLIYLGENEETALMAEVRSKGE